MLRLMGRGQIDAIKPIYQMREYDDPEQKNSNVLSYKRSMSVSSRLPDGVASGLTLVWPLIDPEMFVIPASRKERRHPNHDSSADQLSRVG